MNELQRLMNEITNLGNQIRTAAMALANRAMDSNVSIDDVKKDQAALDAMKQRLAALQAAYDVQVQTAAGGVQPTGSEGQKKSLKDMLKSNEYARAFAYAIQNGIGRKNGRGNEQMKILYDALTESGGNPVGTDGGFLVPEDIDHSIRELRRTLNPLAQYFGEENVTAPTGWRVTDTAPTRGLVDVNEMGQISANDDQPAFHKVPYTTSKKALILPVSNELMTDNVANLFQYLSQWFAKKLVITENAMLVTLLRTLTAVDISTDPLKGIKKALNVDLDPAIAAVSTIITNQSGFNELDNLLDDNKRPLLQPDPTNATVNRIKGHTVAVASDATLPNVTSGEGQSATTAADIFIGDGREFATLFRCGGFELASTDIGGSAWRTDSTEIRGIARLGVTKFDEAAMVRRSLTV